MGIQGLLPFLKSIQRPINVSSFRGLTVAVDAYCWLHKGAYSCAQQLVMKEGDIESLPYVNYCMKRINMLRMKNIKVIVVFDGCHLPTKAAVEAERRKRRHDYLKKGKDFLREGKRTEAIDCFQRCVDVSPQMALAFIKACRGVGVECIVAPYEADAQLAYLSKTGVADLIITEDSDLLVFGSKKVLFKMGESGDGMLIESARLGDVEGGKLQGFSETSFRHMCILSGCDYLASVPGLGLFTANKLLKRFGKDPQKVIQHLRMQKGKAVPKDYAENFIRAEHTFLYQLVFDPRTQSQVRLSPFLENSIEPEQIDFAGAECSPRKAVGLARGNINPITFEAMNNYSPLKDKVPDGARKSDNVRIPGSSKVRSHSVFAGSGQLGLPPSSMATNPAFSSSKKASKPFKPPTQVKGPSEDHSLGNSELLNLYGSSSLERMQTTVTEVEEEEEEERFSQTTTSHNIFSTQISTATILSESGKDDDSTPLGMQSRLLTRLKLVAKGLKFEPDRSAPCSAVGSLSKPGASRENVSSEADDEQEGNRGLNADNLPAARSARDGLAHQPSTSSESCEMASRTALCGPGTTVSAVSETNSSSFSSASAMDLVSLASDQVQSTSQSIAQTPRVPVRKSLLAFSFSLTEADTSTPVKRPSSPVKRPPSGHSCPGNPPKRFNFNRFSSQESVQLSGIGFLERSAAIRAVESGSVASDSQGFPDLVDGRGPKPAVPSTASEKDTAIDLDSKPDLPAKLSFLDEVKKRAVLSSLSRKKHPATVGLARPGSRPSGFKPPQKAADGVQTKLTTILQRCKFTKKEGIKR